MPKTGYLILLQNSNFITVDNLDQNCQKVVFTARITLTKLSFVDKTASYTQLFP